MWKVGSERERKRGVEGSRERLSGGSGVVAAAIKIVSR